MMKRLNVFVLILALLLPLWGCGNQKAANGSSVAVAECDSCVLRVTLEGENVESARVVIIAAEKTADGAYVDGPPVNCVFDGTDTWFAVTDAGGEYIIEVTTSEGESSYRLAMLEESRVCSYHINLEAKADTGYRHLWPQTPHNTPEP